MQFIDRIDAANQLATLCKAYQQAENTIVIGLPRGGVPIAKQLASKLKLPMDILLVRKLGVPWHQELAFGAIASNNITVINDDVVTMSNLTAEQMQTVKNKEQAELARREQRYRANRPPLELKNKKVILTDDGIATGATIKAAVAALREMNVENIIIACPVSARDTYLELKNQVDDIIVCATPEPFWGVGQWYQEFAQVSDEDVVEMMDESV